MIFTKDLLLKGLAGLAVCGGATTIGVHYYTGGFSSSSSEVKVTEKDLGLPADCRFPAAGATTSCNLTTDNINNIKFDGENSTPASITGSGTPQATLEISKDTDFPHGYLFTISVPSGNTGVTLTISRDTTAGGNIIINAGKSADFKVKKTNDGFTLEEAFTLNTLTNKLADFTCTNGECQIGSTAISIKQGNHTESKTKNTTQSDTPVGKIKVYSGEEDYNKGFKFVIEEGDIDLTGTSGNNITKFEQFETYEIKKEGDTWALVRKHKAIDEIKTIFGLPTNCTENGTETVCESLDKAKLTAIKFDGKGDGEVTITESDSATIKLKVSKATNKTDFPLGYKFVLESNKDISIPQGSGTAITIKKETNTEFKIKKVGEGKSAVLTLEKAWTVTSLGAKINLTGCTTNGETKECSFGNSISVYDNDTNKVVGATITGGNTDKKLTYKLDKEGYNQGIKFYIPHSSENITINGGTAGADVTAVTTISKETSEGVGPSYEIKEMSGTWYLVKKSTGG